MNIITIYEKQGTSVDRNITKSCSVLNRHENEDVTDSEQYSPTSPFVKPYRQLPCKTFIATGSCPYYQRCVFIHDPRLEIYPAFPKKMKVE